MRAQDNDNDRGTGRSAPARTGARPALAGPAAALLALQRTAGNAAVSRAVEEERHQHDAGCGHQPAVQRRSLVHEVLRSPGQPMDGSLQNEMEARFQGADFSGVRVHSDAVAQRSALEIRAKAYTSGTHVVDGGGMSKEDWAHELTHYLDQQAGPVPGRDNGSGLNVSDPADSGERHAVDNARRVMSGPAPIQRTATAGGTERRLAHDHGVRYDHEVPGGHEVSVGRAAEAARAPAVQRSPSSASQSSGRVSKSKSSASGKGRAKRAPKAATVAAELAAQLTHLGWVSHGGAQSLTLHKPVPSADAPDHAQPDKLRGTARDQLYAGTDNLRRSRTYTDDERTRQALRWISTVALNYLQDKQPEEVQAAVSRGQTETDPDAMQVDGADIQEQVRLYISSNRNAANEVLRDLQAGKESGKEFVAAMVERITASTDREQRHRNKLNRRILRKDDIGTIPQAFWEIVEALSGPVAVPERVDGAKDGLHAERRIYASAPEGSVTPQRIAGVKRPCMACYLSLYQGTSLKPGPYWPSKAANIDLDNYAHGQVAPLAAEIDRIATAAGGTHATLVDCGGEVCAATWAYDTDSDSPASNSSDEESGPVPAEAGR
ncbi:eCIS core domain-containing protein [Streptomyces sp. NPDC002306]